MKKDLKYKKKGSKLLPFSGEPISEDKTGSHKIVFLDKNKNV